MRSPCGGQEMAGSGSGCRVIVASRPNVSASPQSDDGGSARVPASAGGSALIDASAGGSALLLASGGGAMPPSAMDGPALSSSFGVGMKNASFQVSPRSLLRRIQPSWPTASTSLRSEEHTSELPSLMRVSYAVFCLTQKQHRTEDI